MTKAKELYEQTTALDYESFCDGIKAAIRLLEKSQDRHRKDYFISLIKEALNDNH